MTALRNIRHCAGGGTITRSLSRSFNVSGLLNYRGFKKFSQNKRSLKQPADEDTFRSIVDNPPNLVRTGRRHGRGLIILGRLKMFSGTLYCICLTLISSSNTCHGVRPRDMAGTTTGLEIQTDCEIRRSFGARAFAFTSSYRS